MSQTPWIALSDVTLDAGNPSISFDINDAPFASLPYGARLIRIELTYTATASENTDLLFSETAGMGTYTPGDGPTDDELDFYVWDTADGEVLRIELDGSGEIVISNLEVRYTYAFSYDISVNSESLSSSEVADLQIADLFDLITINGMQVADWLVAEPAGSVSISLEGDSEPMINFSSAGGVYSMALDESAPPGIYQQEFGVQLYYPDSDGRQSSSYVEFELLEESCPEIEGVNITAGSTDFPLTINSLFTIDGGLPSEWEGEPVDMDFDGDEPPGFSLNANVLTFTGTAPGTYIANLTASTAETSCPAGSASVTVVIAAAPLVVNISNTFYESSEIAALNNPNVLQQVTVGGMSAASWKAAASGRDVRIATNGSVNPNVATQFSSDTYRVYLNPASNPARGPVYTQGVRVQVYINDDEVTDITGTVVATVGFRWLSAPVEGCTNIAYYSPALLC